MINNARLLALSFLLSIGLGYGGALAGTLKTHGIFSSNMVIQRDKPITIWGWAEPGQKVSVQLGQAKAEATAGREAGRWEVKFPARPADATGQKLTVISGEKTIELDNIVIGDVWVMNGQSNMANLRRQASRYWRKSASYGSRMKLSQNNKCVFVYSFTL